MKITAVDAELHIYDEQVNWSQPIRIAIKFEDGSHLRVETTGGDMLIVSRLPLEAPLDMGKFGRTQIFDFTERLGPALRGAQSAALMAIMDAGLLIGFALLREGEEPFCFWVNGDEFSWGPETALKNVGWADGREPRIGGPLVRQGCPS